MVKKIHVSAQNIRANQSDKKKDLPVIIVWNEDQTITECQELKMIGDSKLVYNRKNPLPGNIQVWIEADEVEVIN